MEKYYLKEHEQSVCVCVFLKTRKYWNIYMVMGMVEWKGRVEIIEGRRKTGLSFQRLGRIQSIWMDSGFVSLSTVDTLNQIILLWGLSSATLDC